MSTAPKHQPATPLPWYRNGSSHVYNTGRASDVGGEWPVCYATFTEPKDGAPQNAAYIAHAANSYPKLVEALRSALSASKGDWQKGQSWDRAATALLRELGEAE